MPSALSNAIQWQKHMTNYSPTSIVDTYNTLGSIYVYIMLRQ